MDGTELKEKLKRHRNILWAVSLLTVIVSLITFRLGCEANDDILRLDSGKLDQLITK